MSTPPTRQRKSKPEREDGFENEIQSAGFTDSADELIEGRVYGDGNNRSGLNPAVTVRGGKKRYGTGPHILNNFDMTVERGTIYSLLGSSGCGKTTLLSCLVGIRHLNSGKIRVFGSEPGSKKSGIPGYMPQDTALYNDFTISEAVRYFGTLYGMPKGGIISSRDFLISFLDLPDSSRRIGTLSGGQKRRVSLALSLVHSPKLLILDEPTVGVDPLLRESIWNHLTNLVSQQNTTVIITTHYIEEAKQSNTIGVMRGGRLLAEKSPQALLQEHGTQLLEDIVIHLCRKDGLGTLEEDSMVNDRVNPQGENEGKNPTGSHMEPTETLDEVQEVPTYRDSVSRIKALVMKNVLVMTRNLILLVFMVLVPGMQVLATCIAIGNDPSPMHIGVVNQEFNISNPCLIPRSSEGGCDVANLSCHFLSKLPPQIISLRDFKTEQAGRAAVENGEIWGFLKFPEGFSEHLYTRSSSGNIVDCATLEGSQIQIEMDMSNKQIAVTLKRIFYDSYTDFVTEVLRDCGFHPELGESPLKFQTPIFGTDDTDFKEYVAPSIVLAALLFFPMCSSGISYIWDKKQGTLERAMVAGVQTWEIITAFFITEASIIVIQAVLSLIIVCFMYGIVVQGSFLLLLSLTILMGLTGVSLGFLIASFCNEEIEAVMLAIGIFFPNLFLSGSFWPIEGMPVGAQYISYLLPSTLAGESIRSILSRGWEFTHINVWPGFAALFSWICIYCIVTTVVHTLLARRK